MTEFVNVPYIRRNSIEARSYQRNIAMTCLDGPTSTLVVLPTGLGKTVVAALVAGYRLASEEGKVLFLAPTRPLVEQHLEFLSSTMNLEVVSFTGAMAPGERGTVWDEARVVVSTPQVVQNDILAGRYDLSDVSLLCFDEAHRATGNYSYVFVAERYREDRTGARRSPLTLGITASPGSRKGRVLEVCDNLAIERAEIRTEGDPDVRPYVHEIGVRWRIVELGPGEKRVLRPLRELRRDLIKALQDAGVVKRGPRVSTKALLGARKKIRRMMDEGEGDRDLFRLSVIQAKAMTVSHAILLAETQGLAPLGAFFDRMMRGQGRSGNTRSAAELVQDERMVRAIRSAREEGGHHPKIDLLMEILEERFEDDPGSRVIVFSNFRDTSLEIMDRLSDVDAIRPCRFVGQASRGDDGGMTQKEQVQVLGNFGKGRYNVLVATSVAEEGLDIPATDLVVFYEPVSSEIRSIQRRGRTGRSRAGKVEILITKGTRDERAFWASRRRESRMRKGIETLREELGDRLDVGTPGIPPRASVTGPFDGSEGGATRHPTHHHVQQELVDYMGRSTGEGTLQGWKDGEGCGRSGNREPLREVDRRREARDKEDLDEEGVMEVQDIVSRPKGVGNGERAPPIVVDHRELGSKVCLEMGRMDLTIDPRQLEIGDYLISDSVCVERKSDRDLADSLVDGRLFEQVGELASAYDRPLLVIEGEGLSVGGNVKRVALEGALLSVMVDYGVPVLRTDDGRGTAEVLGRLAEREARDRSPVPARRGTGRPDLEGRMEMLIEGLPDISATLSRRLLDHFGSVRSVINASMEELMEVEGIGAKRAGSMIEVTGGEYGNEEGQDDAGREDGNRVKKGMTGTGDEAL